MDFRHKADMMARAVLRLVGEDPATVQLPVTVHVTLPSGASNTVTVDREHDLLTIGNAVNLN